MGVARGQAEQAGENRESSHPVSPAGVQIRVDKEEHIDLRWAAAYWKAQPREAVEREADLKSDNEELRARIREGRPLDPFPGTDDAQVVEIETRVWRRVIRRRRYRPSCTCGVLPGLVTAPSPSPFDRTRQAGHFGGGEGDLGQVPLCASQ